MIEQATRGVSRRQVLVGGALLATASIAYSATPRRKIDFVGSRKLDTLVPSRIENWSFLTKSGLVVPPQDQLVDRLYDQLLTRVYVGEGLPSVMLLIAQSPTQDGTLQVHRPEVCYPASGYRLSNSRRHVIRLPQLNRDLPTRMFKASGDGRTEQLLYWTRVGLDLPTSWTEQRLAVARANLRGEVPDAVLVRISLLSHSEARATETLDRFARALITGLPDAGKIALIGPLSAAS